MKYWGMFMAKCRNETNVAARIALMVLEVFAENAFEYRAHLISGIACAAFFLVLLFFFLKFATAVARPARKPNSVVVVSSFL